jgi:putative ABC transport system permease protein
MARFVAFNRPEDVFAAVDSPAVAAALVELPQVDSFTRTPYMFLAPSASGSDLGGGAALITLIVIAGAALAAWRTRPHSPSHAALPRGQRRVARVAALAARTGLPPSAVTGLTLKSEGGSLSGPAVIVAGVMAIAGLTASLLLPVSLDRLVNSPRQQGWTWDALVGNPNTQEDFAPAAVPLLRANPLVDGYTTIAIADGMLIDGTPVSGAAIDQIRGSVQPPILESRGPSAPDEIVFGTRTLAQIGRHVGDTVTVVRGTRRVDMQIVGRLLVPSVGTVFSGPLDEGVELTLDGYRRLQPDATAALIAVTYAPGASRSAAFASLRHDFGRVVLTHLPASDVENLHQIRMLPYALAGLLVLLGLATTAHTLTTSVRQRRSELAVLKTIGFRRDQVAASVAWQAIYLASIALVLGLPLGVLAGTSAWHTVATRIGAVSPPVLPAVALTLIVPATIASALLLSAIPAWRATRVRPAAVLRSN